MEKTNLTPLMKQYWDVKNQHPDKIVFFRMGDFFELFYEDAQTAAPLLGITLTSRNKKSQDQTPMCGLPHHSVAGAINKLLRLGLKVALCDQVEDPKLAKGIVKREVTKILTPGMVFDFDTLDATKSNFIVCVYLGEIYFYEVSTFETFKILFHNDRELLKILSAFEISEILCLENQIELLKTLKITLTTIDEGLKKGNHGGEILTRYLKYLNPQWQSQRHDFPERVLNSKMQLSLNTIKHLEIFESYRGDEDSSLFHVVNLTKTAAGSRKLKSWLRFPLTEKMSILQRQERIQFFIEKPHVLKKIREVLVYISDIERKLSKVDQSQCLVRDVQGLLLSLLHGEEIIEILQQTGFLLNSFPLQDLPELKVFCQDKMLQLVEEAPLSLRQGGLFRKNVFADLDEWIELATNSQALVSQMEQRERERTGIGSLKIRYNQVFGYYIEITNTHSDKVPQEYKRKQTLTNAERFYTEELLELEKKVLQAQTRRGELEYQYFEELKTQITQKTSIFLQIAQVIAEIDVYASLAWLALESNYVKPTFKEGGDIQIEMGRHPVVEKVMKERFVPNSLSIGQNHCWLITGPNMAGKSTLMRQVALIQILGQIGSFVPATSCSLPLLESIHTRIGASDNLSEGLSTFMVEMVETAEMLKEATSRSLILLDEIGRGTATYDGLSLAEAIVEYLAEQVKSYTLFATHYHELTAFEGKFLTVKNWHMAISEKNSRIEFQHLLKPGAAGKSYGIQVAELAGMPIAITEKAKKYLAMKTEAENKISEKVLDLDTSLRKEVHPEAQVKSVNKQGQLALFFEPSTSHGLINRSSFEADFAFKDEEILAPYKEIVLRLNKIDISRTTPLQALNHLHKMKEYTESLL